MGIDLSGSAAEGKEKEELEKLLASYADVFSDGKRDLGNCKLGVQHRIHLKPDTVYRLNSTCVGFHLHIKRM